MKKFSTICLLALLSLLLVACSPAKVSVFGGSYFLASPNNLGIESIDETNVYSVSYTQAVSNKTTVISVDSAKSSYTTHLTSTTYEETPCYLLETSLEVFGSIDNRGTKHEVNDTISTKCYFLGVEESLCPLYSERTVKSKSIVLDGAEEDGSLRFDVYDYDYEISVKYDDYDAVATVTVNKKAEEDLRFNSFENREFNDLKGKSAFVENELLMFAPRAMALTNATAKTFNTLDVVSWKNHKMIVKSIAEEPTKKFEDFGEKGYFRNGEKVLSVLTYGLEMTVDSDAPGTSIIAYYADRNNASERASMISASVTAPYSLGKYTYTINNAKTHS